MFFVYCICIATSSIQKGIEKHFDSHYYARQNGMDDWIATQQLADEIWLRFWAIKTSHSAPDRQIKHACFGEDLVDPYKPRSIFSFLRHSRENLPRHAETLVVMSERYRGFYLDRALSVMEEIESVNIYRTNGFSDMQTFQSVWSDLLTSGITNDWRHTERFDAVRGTACVGVKDLESFDQSESRNITSRVVTRTMHICAEDSLNSEVENNCIVEVNDKILVALKLDYVDDEGQFQSAVESTDDALFPRFLEAACCLGTTKKNVRRLAWFAHHLPAARAIAAIRTLRTQPRYTAGEAWPIALEKSNAWYSQPLDM